MEKLYLLIACIFFSIKSIRNSKENTLEEMNKNLKILDWAIYVSYATILILLFLIHYLFLLFLE